MSGGMHRYARLDLSDVIVHLTCVGLLQMSKQMAAMQSQSPLVQARNFAVMTGVNAGAAMAIKHARGGKDDVRGA